MRSMTLLLLPLAVLSFGMSLETSSHPMYCDLYNQCIHRENTCTVGQLRSDP